MSWHCCRCACGNSGNTGRRLGWSAIFLSAVLIGHVGRARCDEPASAATQPELLLRMASGSPGRYVSERWGTTRAIVTNKGTDPQTALVVVTPPGSQGLQYAKEFTVPGGSSYQTSWPVRLGTVDSQTVDVPYLMFPQGSEDGLIHRKEHDDFVPNYSALVETNRALGLTGLMADPEEPTSQIDSTLNLLRLMSYSRRMQQNVNMLQPAEMSHYGESLDSLDQLTITSSKLLHHPHAIESVRTWLQRGGRLWIRLDRTGVAVARALLDDALPLSDVGETSTNNVLLTLNPDYRHTTYPTREVERTFDEPIRYVRVVQEGGEAIWEIDGWPVAIRIAVGRGMVIVTTVDSAAFCVRLGPPERGAPEYGLIPSAGLIQTALFSQRQQPLLRQESVTEQAATVIGYQIPSRFTAIGLTLCFPALLLLTGIWLQRRERGERLIFLLPVLAILVALPAIGIGSLGRRVAPRTVIETAFVQSVPGARHLVSDGYAAVFDFGQESLDVSGSNGTIVEVDIDPTNRDYRSLVWTGAETSHWDGLAQPNGIRTFRERSIETLERPLFVTATFDEKGVVGNLDAGGLTDVGDLIIAGGSPDRMSLQLDSTGQFRGTADDVLATGNFSGSALVTDQQRRRAEIYASVFDMTGRDDAFPDRPSLLFWAQSSRQMLKVGESDMRQERSLLVCHPLQVEPPAIGQKFTVPSPFLVLRTMADADGKGFSPIFDNAKRRWLSTENGAHSFMQFEMPSVCLPFEVSSAELALVIRAGSRSVRVSAGSLESQSVVSELGSPLGRKQIVIPVELIRESCRSGKLYVSIIVSDLEESLQTDGSTEEQNDDWEIFHLGLTLTGERSAEGR